MKPASFFAALSGLLLTGSLASAASLTPAQPGNDDTIMVKLPNQVSMTIVARNKQQLRELKGYKLDSLMVLLDAYVSQAEAAGRKNTNGQVTMEFYPAKDKPGSTAAPEQVRVTVRGSHPNADRVEVFVNKKLGVTVENGQDADGGNVRVTINGTDVKADSVKRARKVIRTQKRTGTEFAVDLGLNALVNKKTYAPGPAGVAQPYDLRTWGSRYVALRWNFWARTGKNSPLYFHLGPELAFNNYMLEGNRYFAINNADNRTDILHDDQRNLEKSKLAVTTLNLPVGFTLKFRDHDTNKEIIRIGAGAFAGYRVGAHTKLKYDQDGRTHKDKDRGSYNLEDFQYGLTGRLGIRSLDLFVKYNMNDVFKTARGPQAQTVSFGITLGDI